MKPRTVIRQSRKRKFLHGCERSLEQAGVGPHSPRPCLCPRPRSLHGAAPGLCWCPPTRPRLCPPGSVQRHPLQALLHSWELQRQLSCSRLAPEAQVPCGVCWSPRAGGRWGGEWGGQGGRGVPLPMPVLALWEALGPWETPRASLRHPLPSAPRRPSLIASDSGQEAGKAGAPVVERLLGQAQPCFGFLCYIWRLMSQEWLPRGENPEGAGCR